MIEQPFFENPAKTACPKKSWLTFENFFRATRRLFWMIHPVIGHFLEFGPSDQLDIAYYDGVKWSQQFDYDVAHAGSFKNHSNAFWMIQRPKKDVFGPSLEFGLLDRLDIIAYGDSTKCFLASGIGNRSYWFQYDTLFLILLKVVTDGVFWVQS